LHGSANYSISRRFFNPRMSLTPAIAPNEVQSGGGGGS
jgi:hypothetical protein